MCVEFQAGEANEKSLRERFGEGRVAFMRVDITSHSNFEAAFEKCFELYGGVDVLVNNAGVDGEINWESQLQINFYVRELFGNPIFKEESLFVCG